MRAQKYVVLPDEDAAAVAALESALIAELAPVGALQAVLARRGAVAAWRLARADRLAAGTGLGPRRRTERGRGPIPNQSGDAQPAGQQVELFAERSYDAAGPGLALIRDGNGTRSFETLLRYRGAAMAEFWRALRTLKALQAEQATTQLHMAAGRPPLAHRPQPNQPGSAAGRPLECALRESPAPGRTLHEPAAPWMPNEPDLYRLAASAPAPCGLVPNEPDCDCTPNEPERRRGRAPDQRESGRPPRIEPSGMRATESHGRVDRLNEYRANG